MGVIPYQLNNPIFIGVAIVVIIFVTVGIAVLFSRSGKATCAQRQQEAFEPKKDSQPEEESKQKVNTKPTIVLIYADWCGHSKRILPAWDRVREILGENNQIEVLDFEEKRDKQMVEKLTSTLSNFGGFPDIRMFPEGFPGKSIEYTGDRSEDSILKFAYTNGEQS